MLEQILTSSVLITGILAIRFLLGSRMQQRIKYALWLIVLVKLLMPFLSFENPYSVMRIAGAAGNYLAAEAQILFGSQAEDKGQAAQTQEGRSAEIQKGHSAQMQGGHSTEIQEERAAETQEERLAQIPQEERFREEQTAAQTGRTAGFSNFAAVFSGTGTRRMLYLVWAGGMCVMGLCMLAANIKFFLRLKSCRREILPDAIPVKIYGAETLPGKSPVKIYEAEAVSVPCLFGIFRPAVYLPEELAESGVCMEHIIVHEYMHYRHGDYVWALLRCVCTAAYWFDPFVWAAAAASMRDGELACDEAAIAYLGEGQRQSYGSTLIQMAARFSGGQPFLSCAAHAKGNKGEMKGRIMMIVKRPKATFLTGAALLLSVCLLGCAAFGSTEAKEGAYGGEQPKQTQNSVPERIENSSVPKQADNSAAQESAGDNPAGTAGDSVWLEEDADNRNSQNPGKETGSKNAKEKDTWEYLLNQNADGCFIDVESCQHKNGAYVLYGITYADDAVALDDEEKKRLDNGEVIKLVCKGGEVDYTLEKSADTESEGGYLLTAENSFAMELVEGGYGDKEGWILSDPFSGMPWHPVLKEDTITAAADTPVEVHNYYAYYDFFSGHFTVDEPDKKAKDGKENQWTMQKYYEQYLMNIVKLIKQGMWEGKLAKIRVSESGGSLHLTDYYMP